MGLYIGMGATGSGSMSRSESERAEPIEPVPIVGFKRSSEPNRLKPTQTDSDIINLSNLFDKI